MTLPLLFFSSILYIPTRLFSNFTNKKSFKRNKSVKRKCYQLLMYLFVTLLINKILDSDNRHFLFNILKTVKKEEFLTSRTFCTFGLIEKSILRKRVPHDALSKLYLNKYGSSVKFILLLLGDMNLNPGPTTPASNDRLWELLPFHNCSFSAERVYYQLDSFPEFAMTHGAYFLPEMCKEACTSSILV